MEDWVFAFGSNMCRGRLMAHGVSPLGAGQAAVLPEYRLAFDKLSVDKSGKANVRPAAGECVWGVLWKISDAELDCLDKGEGSGYQRKRLDVLTNSGETISAWVYVATEPDASASLKPYTWYKQFLVEGAEEHKLHKEYIDKLSELEAVEDPDRGRDADKRRVSCRQPAPS